MHLCLKPPPTFFTFVPLYNYLNNSVFMLIAFWPITCIVFIQYYTAPAPFKHVPCNCICFYTIVPVFDLPNKIVCKQNKICIRYFMLEGPFFVAQVSNTTEVSNLVY